MTDETTEASAVTEVGAEPLDQEAAMAAAEGEGTGTVEDDLLATPEIKLPPKQADVHQGIISGVETYISPEKGTVAIQVNLQSTNNPNVTDKKRIWVPPQFVENIYVTDDEMINEIPEGKKQSPRTNLGRAKQDIDNLRTLAKAATRSTADAAQAALGEARRPTTFDEYVAVLNALTAGIDVVFRRRPQRDDDQFLEVDGIYGSEILDDTATAKKRAAKLFSGRALAWALAE